MNIKTRIAPSPTGYLHVGSLRTALYNYLFAKKHKGSFVLRVEDTDRNRLVEGAIESLIRTMQAVGITYDEGPVLNKDGTLSELGDNGSYIQSERLDIYKEHAKILIENKSAYHCFCSKDRLDELRSQQQLAKMQTKYDRACCKLSEDEVESRIEKGEPHVIRLLLPEGETTFHDEVRGSITINNSEIDDQVLVKTDGFPTYHLAVVVDDHLMGITHVIRGEEWISSVPKHVILYNAFGFNLPTFAHLPLILNPDRSKLSKRQGDVAVEDFLEKGYLPEALINYVALLGFNPSADREIYSIDELIQAIDLSKINKSGAIFDLKKLDWMNSQYLKALDADSLLHWAGKFDGQVEQEMLKKILVVEKERLSNRSELEEKLQIYTKQPDYDPQILVWKKTDAQDARTQLAQLLEFINSQDSSIFKSSELIEEAIKRYIVDNGLQNGNVLWPMRVALSGAKNSPSPFELAWVFEKDETVRRLEKALQLLK